MEHHCDFIRVKDVSKICVPTSGKNVWHQNKENNFPIRNICLKTIRYPLVSHFVCFEIVITLKMIKVSKICYT